MIASTKLRILEGEFISRFSTVVMKTRSFEAVDELKYEKLNVKNFKTAAHPVDAIVARKRMVKISIRKPLTSCIREADNKDGRSSLARRGVGSTVACESALRYAGTLLSWVRAPLPVPWPGGGPESLRSPCCGLAINKKLKNSNPCTSTSQKGHCSPYQAQQKGPRFSHMPSHPHASARRSTESHPIGAELSHKQGCCPRPELHPSTASTPPIIWDDSTNQWRQSHGSKFLPI
ncbi:hypothetical protein PoB_005689100 [Plakobranchus ocellatus]|uniref:Uncharacterized protein n=1 Tax=Plakobranchus ocellatus TaxID=259542 RepID=A0AAV4C4Z7_9GAST|nr:hypothetical protein PoB_005689100 [Plakobranchus ocellatus]